MAFLQWLVSVPFLVQIITAINFNFRRGNFAENSNLRNKIISEKYLIRKVKLRSVVECAVFCTSDELCSTNMFEKDSGNCFLYKNPISTGCQERTNISKQYYRKEGSSLQTVLLFIQSENSLTETFNGTWSGYNLSVGGMAFVNLDSATWRLYWADRGRNNLVTSGLKGENQEVLISNIQPEVIALDAINRRLYFTSSLTSDSYLGMVNIDTKTLTKVIDDGKKHHWTSLQVCPDHRLLFWVDDNKLFSRSYDSNTTKQISHYDTYSQSLTVDRIYHRLVWSYQAITYSKFIWTDLEGGGRREVKLDTLFVNVVTAIYLNQDKIYVMLRSERNIEVYSCTGEYVTKLSPSTATVESFKSLVFLPQDVFDRI